MGVCQSPKRSYNLGVGLFNKNAMRLPAAASNSAAEVETDDEVDAEAWEFSDRDVDDIPAQEVREGQPWHRPVYMRLTLHTVKLHRLLFNYLG